MNNNDPIVINFTGGRTSGRMIKLLLDMNCGLLPPNYQIHFQNTGREMPETLDFVRDLGYHYDVDIIWMEYSCPDPTKRPSFKVVN